MERELLRDWHRLFGLLLADLFTGSPFVVEYDCPWGTDRIRVLVAGALPREARNAPRHLISASRELVAFGQGAYQPRSEATSVLLRQLFERLRHEDFVMTCTS